MLSIYIMLIVFGLMMAVGPHNFFVGLASVLCLLVKALKLLLDILDILEIIIQIMSLFG